MLFVRFYLHAMLSSIINMENEQARNVILIYFGIANVSRSVACMVVGARFTEAAYDNIMTRFDDKDKHPLLLKFQKEELEAKYSKEELRELAECIGEVVGALRYERHQNIVLDVLTEVVDLQNELDDNEKATQTNDA